MNVPVFKIEEGSYGLGFNVYVGDTFIAYRDGTRYKEDVEEEVEGVLAMLLREALLKQYGWHPHTDGENAID